MDLARLIALGEASPECIIELTDGRDPDHDDEQPGELHRHKPKHERVEEQPGQ